MVLFPLHYEVLALVSIPDTQTKVERATTWYSVLVYAPYILH